jgi:UDP-N-acetylmuramate dehydrogenase
MNVRETLTPFLAALADRVKFDHPLAEYTHFRVGGPADALVDVTSVEELCEVLRALKASKIPWWILGSGSNVLVLDKGIRGVVLHLEGAFLKVEREGRQREIVRAATNENFRGRLRPAMTDPARKRRTQRVSAGGAVLMPGLAHTTAHWGLSGLECLVGIPGTVGGGIYMNAGVPEGEIKDGLVSVQGVSPEGEVKRWRKDELDLAYRRSVFQRAPAVVTSAEFELEESTPEACEAKLRGFLRKRTFQPLGEPNIGSMFRNPPGRFAGRLIEQAGLKGMSQGKVQVSPKHANFFINTGGGTASDTLVLLDIVRRKVQAETGINLEPEILVVGEK